MLLNDLQKDIKHVLVDESTSMNELTELLGCSRPNAYKLVRNKELTSSLVRVMEALGYDVKVTYVKREQ